MSAHDEIELFREGTQWMAQYNAGLGRDTALRLFGTDAIPTAFTSQAAPNMVLARIQEINPDALVRLRDDE